MFFLLNRKFAITFKIQIQFKFIHIVDSNASNETSTTAPKFFSPQKRGNLKMFYFSMLNNTYSD